MHTETDETSVRKKKKRKFSKSEESFHNEEEEAPDDSLGEFLNNMFSDNGSADDCPVKKKKKKAKHADTECGDVSFEKERQPDEDSKRGKTCESGVHGSRDNSGCVRNMKMGENNVVEFSQENGFVHNENSESNEQSLKKLKKKKLEGDKESEEHTVLKKSKKKKKHKTSENLTDSATEDELASIKSIEFKTEPVTPEKEATHKKKKHKDKSGDSEYSNCSSEETSREKKKHKKKKKHEEERCAKFNSERETEVKHKKRKHRDQSADRTRDISVSSASGYSNSEEIVSKKKKKKHEEFPEAHHNDTYSVPKIKKKKDKGRMLKLLQNRTYEALPIKMQREKKALEDCYMSSDYSVENESIKSPSFKSSPKNKQHVDDFDNLHKSKQIKFDSDDETGENVLAQSFNQKESHEVARSESASSPDTYTIEVQEDKESGSYSPASNGKKLKLPSPSPKEKKHKRKLFEENDGNINNSEKKHKQHNYKIKLFDKTENDGIESDLDENDKYDLLIAEKLDETDPTLDEDLLKIGRLYILIPWVIPPLHLIETRVASGLTNKQRMEIASLNVPVKMGIFSREEDEQIKANFQQFCHDHDLPEDATPFLNFTYDKQVVLPVLERIKFVRFLAHNLNDRLLYAVYKRFRRLYRVSKIKTGRFSDEEDRIIMHYMINKNSTTPFANLGKILNRDKLAVERRYKKMLRDDASMLWEDDQIRNLVRAVAKVTGCDKIEHLRNRELTKEEWVRLSCDLGIPVEKLRRAWKHTAYPRIFVPERYVQKTKIKLALINLLLANNETDFRSLKWDEIAKHFDGYTGAILNKMLKSLIYYYVPVKKRNDLGTFQAIIKQQHSQTDNMRSFSCRGTTMKQTYAKCLKWLSRKFSGDAHFRGRQKKLDVSDADLQNL